VANFGKALGAGLETLGAGLIKQGEFEGNMMYLTAAADKEYARKAGAAGAKAQLDSLTEVYKQTVGSHKELLKTWGTALITGPASTELTAKIILSSQNVLNAQNDLLRHSGLTLFRLE